MFTPKRVGVASGNIIHLILETFDFEPGLQSSTNRPEIQRLHVYHVQVHPEYHFAGKLLVAQDLTMLSLHAGSEEIFGDLIRIPGFDFLLGGWDVFLFVRLLSRDIREAMMVRLATTKIRTNLTWEALRWGALAGGLHVSNVFVDDAKRLMHDGTVLRRRSKNVGENRGEDWG